MGRSGQSDVPNRPARDLGYRQVRRLKESESPEWPEESYDTPALGLRDASKNHRPSPDVAWSPGGTPHLPDQPESVESRLGRLRKSNDSQNPPSRLRAMDEAYATVQSPPLFRQSYGSTSTGNLDQGRITIRGAPGSSNFGAMVLRRRSATGKVENKLMM